MEKKWSKGEIAHKLETDVNWLKRGVVAIYNYQTEYEKRAEDTRENNKVGFSGCDGKFLSSIATWILSGRKLTDRQVAKTRKAMIKYAGQLAKIANGQQA